MTTLLEKAIDRVSGLSAKKQDALAHLILAELDSDAQWDNTLKTSQHELAALAGKELVDREAGKTTEIRDVCAPYELPLRAGDNTSATVADLLESKVMQLATEDRARLAERLILSLDAPSKEENLRLWVAEADRRLQALRAGKAREIPAHEVFRRAKAALA
jgi:putative addiction module component (TIGR02574 family)